MEDTLTKKRFMWGLLLAWIPWVPTMIGIGLTVNKSKATGLAALVGGMAELFVWWGLTAIIISQIVAMVWLIRSLSGTNLRRSIFSVLSIFASALTLFLVCAFLIVTFHFLRQPH